MAKSNRVCLACQNKYDYCPSCSRADALKAAWHSEFCSETCMTLWTTATKYNMNMITKEEAQSIVSNLDLNPIDTYAACIQRDYIKIMGNDKKSRKNKKPEPIVEVVEQPVPEIELTVEAETIELAEVQMEQPIVAEFVDIEPTVHEVVLKEDE